MVLYSQRIFEKYLELLVVCAMPLIQIGSINNSYLFNIRVFGGR